MTVIVLLVVLLACANAFAPTRMIRFSSRKMDMMADGLAVDMKDKVRE
jgi:hypothetical protein